MAVSPSRCRRGSGRSMRSSSAGLTGVPTDASGSPAARRAATGREDVAAVEGRRERDQPELLVAQLVRVADAAVRVGGVHQQPVVGAHEEVVAVAAQGDRPSWARPRRGRRPRGCTALSGMYGSVLRRTTRPGQHVALRQPVGDVDDADLGRQPGDDRAAHAGEVVGVAVVAEEADRPVHAANLRRSPVAAQQLGLRPESPWRGPPPRTRRRAGRQACAGPTRPRPPRHTRRRCAMVTSPATRTRPSTRPRPRNAAGSPGRHRREPRRAPGGDRAGGDRRRGRPRQGGRPPWPRPRALVAPAPRASATPTWRLTSLSPGRLRQELQGRPHRRASRAARARRLRRLASHPVRAVVLRRR